jgi:hypothetical protein
MTEITDDLPARLLHEEHSGWQAILEGHGGEYYQRTMTRDALVIVTGAVLTREQVADSFVGVAPWDRYEIREPAVIRLGERAGILVYRAVAVRGDETVDLIMSTTYLFENGGWCIAAHQQTPVG